MSFAVIGTLLLGASVIIGLIKKGEIGCFGGALFLGGIFILFVMVILIFLLTALTM